jgi:tRNA threonylcarbamoyl adenosine modification protein (Sua5/YciO/YrdC/YwlC family)
MYRGGGGVTVLVTIDPVEPENWLIARAAQALRRGVIVIPTDTVYAFACPLSHSDSIDRLYELKQITPAKRLSIMVDDIATAARFTRGISNPVFRAMRRVLPGPYTFIFQASSDVPRIMLRKRRTIGIRIPDSAIALALLEEAGEPLLLTSVRNASDGWIGDPAEIEEKLHGELECVVDGGLLTNEPSTVVDLSQDEPKLLRQGKGDVAALELFD